MSYGDCFSFVPLKSRGWSGGANVLDKLQVQGGWSGGAMMLGKLPVTGCPTIWITVGLGPTGLAVGSGRSCLDLFTPIYPFSPLSPSL